MTSLPNELLQRIIELTDQEYRIPYLFVCKFTFHLVRQRVYKKVIFPDDQDIKGIEIITFCQLYGLSLETIKLPQAKYFPDKVYQDILLLCPHLNFLQSNIHPKQLVECKPKMCLNTCFMVTNLPYHLLMVHTDDEEDTLPIFNSNCQITVYFDCCPSLFIFPSEFMPGKSLTQISHYFHHPGALSNAILPTFGSDLLSLTLNPYDVLTSTVARLIVAKCTKLRYLVAPSVKAEGLWMLLRWCHTLAAIIVGYDRNSLPFNDEDFLQEMVDYNRHLQSRQALTELENERAVETIRHHKRVWCVHPNVYEYHHLKIVSWHIGIIPKI
ncbi:uncharacterized protein BX663DRAFT_484960 [Cokeromyces recurvatus]|uniref:uncharacterized protein n=1 Tax=Cokeromyces recurvatus TaxID=90255 RepID=UPI0022204405|nr:uncharacterized protein BX663DRAFT_484960 [Cokeromyces recurvatus]KAI7904888.1 hypothetical protein BX663DRAFT_484960 [Cokeromyces recurvatus]